MNHNPLVSIIIPTYNRAHLIGETLDSVLAQTYENWECIIVDDGSDDNTAEVIDCYIKKDSRFQYYKRTIDRLKGANACRNYGFELSKGEYINWFDSDDLMDSEKLSIQVKALFNTNFNFSVCQTLVFENSINNIVGLRHDRIFSDNPFADYLMLKVVWLTQSPMWRRSFLETQEYLFDEELQAAQEWEFHVRMLHSSNSYHYTDFPLVYIRKHLNSISYNSNVAKRRFNYLSARIKIYNLLKRKMNEEEKDYTVKFIEKGYLSIVRSGNFWILLKSTLLVRRVLRISYLDYINLLFAYLSWKIFRRGYFLLDRIHFNG
jgi:glycosyltransferase involved in cell wall biosynthesis